ncbi:hypothetical protein [Anoxybacteroides rupiense]|jgi:hypothetical protein|nr:hypothetical protein [Anoxybacillus rupiensis]
MIVNLKAHRTKKTNLVVYIPVFSNIVIEDNKIVGKTKSGKKIVLAKKEE